MKKILQLLVICCFVMSLSSQNVDPFTGGFSYDVPLIYVPSNRGEGVSVNAHYGAGIQMSQSAGEIGLGWSLNAGGAIYRSLVGYPDDTKNYQVPATAGYKSIKAHGALYPMPETGITDYDLDRTNRGTDTAQFIFPGYDNYTVAGPGFSGQMKLSYLRFYSYTRDTTLSGEYKPSDTTMLTANGYPGTGNTYYKRPQFHFENDFADTLLSRHYPAPATATTSFMGPTDAVSGYGYPGGTANSIDPYIGYHQSGTSIQNQNYDPASGRLATSNLVEYFTNQEINSGSVTALVNFESGHSRSGSSYPAEGIGYFRITGSNGLTYHYALPVYVYENTDYTIPLDDNYNPVPNSDTTAYGPDATYTHANNPYERIKLLTGNRYAQQWLLTAVTGPDYVDSDGNEMVNDGDAGYWISYNYKEWNDSFIQRTPYYGNNNLYNPNANMAVYPVYFRFAPYYHANNIYKTTGLYGTVNINRTQLFYLNQIHTSSHTALFVRDIRLDETGGDSAVSLHSGFKPAPQLLLKRIVLINNDYGASIKTAFTPSLYPKFNASAISTDTLFYTEPWYQATHSSWDASVLRQVEFDQDYSLCRNYHGNVNVRCNLSTVLTSQTYVQSHLSVSSYTSSGKLTLNRILNYGFGNVKLRPSLKFDYASGLNPDYNLKKADYWGFYKSDATNNGYSRYTSNLSQNSVQAWSLEKITDALGGITQVDYESNTYNKVIDNEMPGGVRGAAFIYRIKSMRSSVTGNPTRLVMEEGDAGNTLTEFNFLTGGSVTGLKQTLCLPLIYAIDSNIVGLPSSIPYAGYDWGYVTGMSYENSPATNLISITSLTTLPDGSSGVKGSIYSRAYFNGSFGNPILVTPDSAQSYFGSVYAYSGNGFLMLETPVGYDVYGGGVRVKSIRSINSSSETYVKQYSYEGGVATNEMDRFNYPIRKQGCSSCPLHFTYLKPKDFNLFNLPPGIGYSKVTIQDLGQINVANGKVETLFMTDPSDLNGLFSQNYAIQTFTAKPSADVNTINECTNAFANIFGAVKETRLFDINNTLLSKTVNEYTVSQQGALVENFHFYCQNCLSGSINVYTVNIVRNLPYVLKSTSSYGMGTFQKKETLVRDELTGETTAFRTTAKNQSSSVAFKVPAYKYYSSYSGLSALNFTNAAFRAQLPLSNDAYTYNNLDTALSTRSGSSNSFLNATWNCYANNISMRQYNSATGAFYTATVSTPRYFNKRSFAFDAGANSMSDYGLIKKSVLYSNPLSLSTINSSQYWEPTSTYNWRLSSEMTLIDQDFHTLELRDANNRFSASRYAYKNYYKSASAGNCNFASFTFADFENAALSTGTAGIASMDGEMQIDPLQNRLVSSISTDKPHTGSKCIEVSNGHAVRFASASLPSTGGTFEAGLQSGRIYRASVWVHNSNLSNARLVVSISGAVNSTAYTPSDLVATSSGSLVTTINNWNLLQVDFEIPQDFTTYNTSGHFYIELQSASGTVYFDDFVFHPVESSFSASVYDPHNGRVLSNLDGNGLATDYKYNAEGQMTEIWKEVPSVGYKQVKKYTYNYARGANN